MPSALNLKDTPSERARKEDKTFRRAARQARREAKYGGRSTSSRTSSSPRPRHRRPRSASLSPGPRPPPPSTTSRHETEFEEHLRYLEALDQGTSSAFDAFDYGNSGSGVGWGDAPYAGSSTGGTVPLRWSKRRQEDNVWHDPELREPGGLDEESYAESIRQGMWERKNPGEKNRRQRLAEEAIKTAERLDKAKEEGAKLERERLRELEKLKGEKSETRQREEREIYERRWKEFVDSTSIVGSAKGQERELTFVDVPWPVYSAASGIGGKRRRGEERAGVEWMTVSSVGEFLVPPAVMSTLSDDESKKKRKDILREAIRRFHPDKFTRYLALVPEGTERDRVKQGVDQVARVIGDLMSQGG